MARSMELSLLGEKLPAEKALQWGLINRVVDDGQALAEAKRSRELASGPTKALGLIRGLYWDSTGEFVRGTDRPRIPHATHRWCDKGFQEGVTAFLEKRPAKFTGNDSSLRTKQSGSDKVPAGLLRHFVPRNDGGKGENDAQDTLHGNVRRPASDRAGWDAMGRPRRTRRRGRQRRRARLHHRADAADARRSPQGDQALPRNDGQAVRREPHDPAVDQSAALRGISARIIEGGVKIVETAGYNRRNTSTISKKNGVKVIHKCTAVRRGVRAAAWASTPSRSTDSNARAIPAKTTFRPHPHSLRRRQDHDPDDRLRADSATARALPAALALGADGVNMGTRFCARRKRRSTKPSSSRWWRTTNARPT